MGKAKRAKEKRLIEAERKAAADAKKRAEKKENIKIATIIISIILVVAILVTSVCLVVLSVKSKGNYLRDKVSVSSTNYEINNAMLSYLFADGFYMQKSYYDYYSSYFRLDTSAPLKNQDYNDSMTWYDYFLKSAADNAASILVNAEAAKAAGIVLDDNDKRLVEKEIGDLRDAAAKAEMEVDEYISENYGLGVKESDVREVLELYYTSMKYYYSTIYGIDVTAEQINEYYDKNKDDFLRVDYKKYTVTATVKSNATAAEKELASKEAKDHADALAKAKDAAEFDKLLLAYLKENKKDDEKPLDTVEDTLVEGESYNKDSEYSKWLYDDKTKVGDTKVIEDSNGSYTVYMLVTAKAREEYKTHNIRHILFLEEDYADKAACKAAAEAVLAEFNKTGKTEEEFAALVQKYTADTGSFYNGGLYENISKGQMVEEFEDWSYDEKRKAGDVEIVYTESYGYHIMFYCGEGTEAWSATARDQLTEDKYTSISEEIVEKYTVNIDLNKASNIPDINK